MRKPDPTRPPPGTGDFDVEKVYMLSPDAVAQQFNSDLDFGLTTQNATTGIAAYGENSLGLEAGPSAFKVFLSNLFNPMNGVLTIAVALAGAVKDVVSFRLESFIEVLSFGSKHPLLARLILTKYVCSWPYL
ncbi:hypothetical protein HDV00_006063 [Rhizophlyctis rosea]|nr:hypothetical protein HDV00_006063 [Rhizophlyctis rosea]